MKIVASRPKGFKIGAELIMLYQNTAFSHVAIIKDNLVFQASRGCVNCVHIEYFLYNNEIIQEFEIPEEMLDMDFVYRQLGKAYSVLQVLEIAFKYFTGIHILINNGSEKFICSEFVGKALRLDWVNDFTSPKEIADYLESIRK